MVLLLDVVDVVEVVPQVVVVVDVMLEPLRELIELRMSTTTLLYHFSLLAADEAHRLLVDLHETPPVSQLLERVQDNTEDDVQEGALDDDEERQVEHVHRCVPAHVLLLE